MTAPPDAPDVAYVFFNPAEARFVDAAVARLIPADDLGPGAKEAGVTCFIDRQLAGSWGTHARNYRVGPWREGTPQQGYQLPLTPQEIYRAAIREINDYCSGHYGRLFCFLKEEPQNEVLRALETGDVELATAPSRLFFNMLLRNTMEGFFSDPIHGGNRDKIGWRLIGFPGVASASYVEEMGNAEKFNVAYRVEPVSIADIQEKRVKVDAQGYPKHAAAQSSAGSKHERD